MPSPPKLTTQTLIMASRDLRHRTEQEVTQTDQPPNVTTDANPRKPRRSGAATLRGLRSLSAALAFPLSLTLLDIYLFGSTTCYRSLHKPFYFPPLWALHLAFLASAFLSGLSAWLVWADGGFHRRPNALILYLGQLVLSLGWYPIVFGAGAVRAGLPVCAALFAALIGCAREFRSMNQIAGDLVGPCLGWATLLSVLNFRLLYH